MKHRTTHSQSIPALFGFALLALLAACGSDETDTSAPPTLPPVVLQTITITPNPVVMGIGGNRNLRATATYSDGTTANVTNTAAWSSDTSAVAAVQSTTGIVSGVAQGSASITATLGSIRGTTALSVVKDVWVPVASLGTGRSSPTATAFANGTVLVAGGNGLNGQAASAAESYDPPTDKWSAAGSYAYMDHTATLLVDGTALFAGGRTLNSAMGSVGSFGAQVYRPTSGDWTSVSNMSSNRFSHAATLLANGRVLVTGGMRDLIGYGWTWSTAEIYDPVTHAWTPAASMSTGRTGHAATLLPDGKVLVTGGSFHGVIGLNIVNAVLSSAEIFDPASGTWSAVASMSAAREGHSAILLKDGRVLVAGGDGTSSAEIYNPMTASWSPTGSTSGLLLAHTAIRRADGTVLALVQGTSTTVTQIFDPATGTWSSTSTLAGAGTGTVTATLADGSVLAVGLTPPGGLLGAGASIYY